MNIFNLLKFQIYIVIVVGKLRRFILEFKASVIGRGASPTSARIGTMLQALSAADVILLSLMILYGFPEISGHECPLIESPGSIAGTV